MGYFDKFDAQETKLENTLSKNYLLHEFDTTRYPMTLTITQNQSPDAQMALYDQDDGDVSSQDAKLVFTFFVGAVGMRTYGRLVIPDDLLTKIKNIGKKMHSLYLQGDFARRMEQAGRCDAASYGGTVESDDGDEDEETGDDEAFAGFYGDPEAGGDGSESENE